MSQANPPPRSQPPALRAGTEPVAPRLGTRVLGWTLMTLTLGLVSCQSLFVI